VIGETRGLQSRGFFNKNCWSEGESTGVVGVPKFEAKRWKSKAEIGMGQSCAIRMDWGKDRKLLICRSELTEKQPKKKDHGKRSPKTRNKVSRGERSA